MTEILLEVFTDDYYIVVYDWNEDNNKHGYEYDNGNGLMYGFINSLSPMNPLDILQIIITSIREKERTENFNGRAMP
jgi:hypothetical protein